MWHRNCRMCCRKQITVSPYPRWTIMLHATMPVETPSPTPEIRPSLEALRHFPTLCHIDETWGKIELKLETEDTRYWVTTRGLSERSRQAPPNYVVNFVTVEKR